MIERPSSDFNKLLEAYKFNIRNAFVLSKREDEVIKTVSPLWKEMARTRQQMLTEILKRDGLDVCSDSTHKDKDERKSKGIFPRSELTYFYVGAGFPQGSEKDIVTLELLCPEHLKDTRQEFSHSDNRASVMSRATEVKGRLITDIGGFNVTGIPVIGHYEENIYEYFGLPSLPANPAPKVDS